jgi:hypothetical protein
MEVGVRLFRQISFAILSLACLSTSSRARIIAGHDYRELLDRSDVVVIATPTATTTDTRERTFVPNFMHVDARGRHTTVRAIGVETHFECVAILKGNSSLRLFVLHYLREAGPNGEADGPELVSFGSADHANYLLFLTREVDGRFAPTGGQTDPGFRAITRLAN